ncbi:MAG: DUF5925 domain-containing protein [Acidimicrobiales bacterium]
MTNPMSTFDELHAVATLGPHTPLSDALRALSLRPFLAGAQPWAATRSMTRVREEASLVPPGVEPVRRVVHKRSSALLATGPGWTLLVERSHDGSARIMVTAAEEALGNSVLKAALAEAVEADPEAGQPAVTRFGFWNNAPWGARMTERKLPACRWADIRRNYSQPVARALDRVNTTELATTRGRLILLHGPPGTGKTTALRALAEGWKAQCRFEYVLDPERMLGEANYLLSVMLGGDDDPLPRKPDSPRPFRLLILEDCDELIRSDAKRSAGQSLGRLLNLTDGILGQGVNLLMAITTNEPLERLHPAVVRPGRCLAQIEVGPLTPAEARTWLGGSGSKVHLSPQGATLAELYAASGAIKEIRVDLAGGTDGSYL